MNDIRRRQEGDGLLHRDMVQPGVQLRDPLHAVGQAQYVLLRLDYYTVITLTASLFQCGPGEMAWRYLNGLLPTASWSAPWIPPPIHSSLLQARQRPQAGQPSSEFKIGGRQSLLFEAELL